MGIRYQRVYTNIWRELREKGCSEDGIVLFVHILTSPHSNLLGLFYCPRSYLLEDLPGKWTQDRLEPAFQEVIHKGLVLYDEPRRMVLIPSHLRHNPFASANHITAAIKLIHLVTRTPLLKEYLKLLENMPQKDIERLIEAVRDVVGEAVKTPTGRRSQGRSGRRSRGVRYAVASQNQEQYKKQKTVTPNKNNTGGVGGSPPGDNPVDRSALPVDKSEVDESETPVEGKFACKK